METHGRLASDVVRGRGERGLRILALDPGTEETGFCLYDTILRKPIDSGVAQNNRMLFSMAEHRPDLLAVEMIASYGMPVGKEIFETCVWIGRFKQRWLDRCHGDVSLIYRKDVKMHLCGSFKAKDANIRQRLIDIIGKPGTKKNPGPTYGIKSHAWPALAVAVTVADGIVE